MQSFVSLDICDDYISIWLEYVCYNYFFQGELEINYWILVEYNI